MSVPNEDQVRFVPATRPRREPLAGARMRLEPLDPVRHLDDLFAAAGDPELWTYMPYGPFPDRDAFATHLEQQAASADPIFLAVVDRISGKALGVVSYLRITPDQGVIEIGHIWFGRALQRTPLATESIYLLARRAFDELGYRRFEWKCNAANAGSMAAARRFGFTYEGTFRQHMIVKGRNRDTAWFSIIDSEWPPIRAAFERWLAADNFDGRGVQRASLAELR